MLYWFSVHAIMYFESTLRRTQKTFVAHENVYLVRAKSASEARRKGIKHARSAISLTDKITINGSSVRMVFGGIRSVVSCAGDPMTSKPDRVTHMYSGVEGTYSRFLVQGRGRLRDLIRGRRTSVIYDEDPHQG